MKKKRSGSFLWSNLTARPEFLLLVLFLIGGIVLGCALAAGGYGWLQKARALWEGLLSWSAVGWVSGLAVQGALTLLDSMVVASALRARAGWLLGPALLLARGCLLGCHGAFQIWEKGRQGITVALVSHGVGQLLSLPLLLALALLALLGRKNTAALRQATGKGRLVLLAAALLAVAGCVIQAALSRLFVPILL